MMQTIRSRFLTVICGVSLTLTLVFGSLCVFLVDRSETEIAAKTLTGRAIHASTTLNPIFMQSEDIVHYIGHTIEHEVKNPQDLRNKANRDRLEAMISRSFYNAVSGIDGVQGYYLHYNEDLAGGPDGFWYTRKDARHDFVSQPITSVEAYGEADAGRTNWYYQLLREKRALLTTPYVNDNNGVRIISYVMPVYVQGQFVAVVGVDIDFNMLCDLIGSMKVYDSGYGFLFKDWQTFYFHPDGREVAYEFKPRFDIVSHGELLEQSATDTHYSLLLSGHSHGHGLCDLEEWHETGRDGTGTGNLCRPPAHDLRDPGCDRRHRPVVDAPGYPGGEPYRPAPA